MPCLRGAAGQVDGSHMNAGIQISSFRPLMTDAEGLKDVLAHMREIGASYTQLQWIDKTVPARTVAQLLAVYGIKACGVQDKAKEIFSDSGYYLEMCLECSCPEICVSGIPDGDADSFAAQMDALSERAAKHGIQLSYHPVKADILCGACESFINKRRSVGLVPDTCQLTDAGRDACSFILAHKGRIRTVHFKDRNECGALCPPGSGITDFAPVVAACRQAGVQLLLAEQETWTDA
ncbi:MAG: sugar phosphate isomerase/epimerase, partial [Synergistes sp.]|nr:sugar phosphate isomerase/epimerase [Synergistes sp.]